MPLLEETASEGTACISTAARFDAAQNVGRRKTSDPSWWAAVQHEYPFGSINHDAITMCWLALASVTVALHVITPTDRPDIFAYGATVLFAVAGYIPDDGARVAPYWIHLSIPLLVFRGMTAGGWWSFLPFLMVFGAVPVLDWLVGVDVTNQRHTHQIELKDCYRFKLQTLAVVPCCTAAVVAGAWAVATYDLSPTEFVGLTTGVGLYTGAIGITVGHELCHKAPWLERLAGRYLLCLVSYGHFYVEHTLGHHKDVATDADPATARFGESFYSFLPRVVVGEFRSAVRIELARLKKKKLPWWRNEILLYFVTTAAMAGGLWSMFGRGALFLFAGQSITAILLFEFVPRSHLVPKPLLPPQSV